MLDVVSCVGLCIKCIEIGRASCRERVAIQIAVEATQMAEIALDRTAKATKKERKFRAFSIQAKEIAVRALEQERKCKIALILSWFFFIYFGYVVFMFWLK